ncbi:MAG: response regulator [Nitrospinae bacterium]|nr:response regulator [Nitrospinota bacterium]
MKRKILIVDDEKYILRVLKLKLENGGYEVICASNGLDGLKKVREDRPDAVITDIHIPEIDGQRLCEEIRKMEDNQPLIIVITGRIHKDDRKWTGDMNLRFIEKPFSPRKILRIIDLYFASSLNPLPPMEGDRVG